MQLSWPRKLGPSQIDGFEPSPSRRWQLGMLAVRTTLLLISGCAAGTSPPPPPFQIIAHRGASAYAPENTIPAFEIARKLGAFEVELDIQLTSDQVVMLYHDASLELKTGFPGAVHDHTAAHLLELEIGSWFDRNHPEVELEFAGTRLNTLAQLFEHFGAQLYYHIELKSGEPLLGQYALAVIDRAGLRDRIRFTSFQFEQLERTKALAPELPHTLLIRIPDKRRQKEGLRPEDLPLLRLQKQQIDLASQAGFDQVGLRSKYITREIVVYAGGKGVSLRAWGIKSDADMMHAIAMGACGMTTNWPDRLIRERGKKSGGGISGTQCAGQNGLGIEY